MNVQQQQLARMTLDGAELGAVTFPQGVQMLIEAGFDGYAVDYRRSVRTYYLPNGEALELPTPPIPPVAEHFDARAVKDAIREAQSLVPGYTYRRLLRQSGRSRLCRLHGLVRGQARGLLRPRWRGPYRVFPGAQRTGGSSTLDRRRQECYRTVTGRGARMGRSLYLIVFLGLFAGCVPMGIDPARDQFGVSTARPDAGATAPTDRTRRARSQVATSLYQGLSGRGAHGSAGADGAQIVDQNLRCTHYDRVHLAYVHMSWSNIF